MREAARGLRTYTEGVIFAEPEAPLYANATCRPYTAAEAPALLGAQVESPVRWTELIRGMQADGYTDFIELGAGKTLRGLIERIGGAGKIARVEDASTLTDTLALL
jgi:[acyl-carrier-protein] S-malonyltransferase